MGGLLNRLAFLTFVLGQACCTELKYGWKPRQEFNFHVDGRSVVGLAQTENNTGFDYWGEMIVESVKENTLHLKLKDFAYNEFRNKTVAPLPITSEPVIVRLSKSQEPQLLFPPDRADWEVNFVKGLVSFITVSYGNVLVSQGPNHKNENSLDENVYSVVEDTVVGRCQVLYEIHSRPEQLNIAENPAFEFCRGQPITEITKTVNYTNCEVVNEDRHGLPTGYDNKEDNNGNIFTRASSTHLTGCGTKRSFVLISSVSESKITSKLLEGNSESLLSSRLNLELRSMQFLKTVIIPPADYETVSGLQYHYQCQDGSSHNVETILKHHILQKQSASDEKIGKINLKPESGEEEDYEDGFVYERRRRSLRKLRKFPKYTHVLRKNPKKKSDYGNSDDYLSSATRAVKTKLADDTSCAPHDKPYTPFFLAHRFAVSCNTSNSSSLRTPYAEVKLNQLLDEIAADLENAKTVINENTLGKIPIAVDYVRLLTLPDLQELSKCVFENISYSEYEMHETVKRNLFRDVVTLSGQRPSFKLISDWIKNKQIGGEEAAQIISALPSYLVPSDTYILREFFELMVAVYNGTDNQLKVTTILGFSNYVRVSTLAAGTLNESDNMKQYTDWLEIHLPDDEDLELVFIRAIGNIPGRHTLGILKSLAMENRLSVYKRSTAVFAMIYSALYYRLPTTVALMSLYHNETLPTPVRISAVSLLFYSTKDISVWQMIAMSTWFGANTPVINAFVWNTLQNLANNEDARYSFLIKAATQVKSMAKPAPDVTHQPFNIITASAVHKLNTMKFEQLEWLDFNNFKSLYYRYSTRSYGLSQETFQAELSATNLYGFLYDLISQPEENCHNTESSHSTQWIKNTLNITPRVMPSFKANLQLKVDNLVERMFSLDKKGLDDLAKELRQLLNEINNNAKNFYYQKSGMMTSLRIATTTEMGFPVEFRVEKPWTIRTSAGLQYHNNSYNFSITFMYASQMMSDIGVYSSWNSKQYTVGMQKSDLFQLPYISLTVQYDKETNRIQIKTKEIEKSFVLYKSLIPFLVQRSILYPKPTSLDESLYNGTLKQHSRTSFDLIQIETERGTFTEKQYRSLVQELTNKMRNASVTERRNAIRMVINTAEPYKYEVTMNGLQPMNLNFSIGLAVVQNGTKRIKTGTRIISPATNLNKLFSLSSDNDDKEDGNEESQTSYLISPAQYLSNYTTEVKGSNMMSATLSETVTNVTTSEPLTTPLKPFITCIEPSTTATEPSASPSEPLTILSDPVTTTKEPSTLLTEPSTTTTESSATTTESLTTTTEQTTELPASPSESLTTLSEPLTTTKEPSTVLIEPSTTTTESSAITTEQSATLSEPLTTLSEPLTTFIQPSNTCTESLTTTTELSASPSEPLTTTKEPSTLLTEPSTTTTESSATTTESLTATTEKTTELSASPSEPLDTLSEPLTTTKEPSTLLTEPLTTTTESSTTTTEPPNTCTESSSTCSESAASTLCPPTLQIDSNITETIHSTDYILQLNKFNASSCKPFADHIIGSTRDYLLLTVLDDLQNGKAYAVDFNFTTGDVNISALLTYAFTLDNLFQRFGAFTKVGNDYQGGLTVTTTKPVTPLFSVRDFVDASPKINLFAHWSGYFSDFTMLQGFVTSRKFHNSSLFDIDDCTITIPGAAISPECRKFINQMSSQIGRLQLNATSLNPGVEWKEICLDFSKIYDNAAFSSFSSLADFFGPHEVQENCQLVGNIPYSQLILKSYEPAYCGITTRRVRTFDRAEYFYAVSHLWHLATQDCSGQHQVAILYRSTRSNINLDIEVNIGNLANLTIKSSGGISFNGQYRSFIRSRMYLFYSKEDGEDVVIMRVYRSPDNAIGIQLPRHGFDITYAYAFIVINANPSMRGRLCGLCGSYTDEKEEKYLLPDGNQADSISTFTHAYDLRD